jgi:hypothetical protein
MLWRCEWATLPMKTLRPLRPDIVVPIAFGIFCAAEAALFLIVEDDVASRFHVTAISVAAGVLGGCAMSVWRMFTRGTVLLQRRSLSQWVRLVFPWALVALFSTVVGLRMAPDWVPVKTAMRFDKQGTLTATFTPELSQTYAVQIDLERTIPFEEIVVFTASPPDGNASRSIGPARPQIVWSIDNQPHYITELCWRGQYWGPTIGLELGSFQAIADQPCTVKLQTITPSLAAQVLNPHLQIALSPGVPYKHYEPGMVLEAFGMFAFLIGALFAVIEAKSQKRLRTRLIAELGKPVHASP